MNVLHITGTKGKGSTSAFTSSILCSISPSSRIGLYTSPHLVAVRERIRINGKPLEEDVFAKYFFEVWDRLDKGPKVRSNHPHLAQVLIPDADRGTRRSREASLLPIPHAHVLPRLLAREGPLWPSS
jgi:hypothetical protein